MPSRVCPEHSEVLASRGSEQFDVFEFCESTELLLWDDSCAHSAVVSDDIRIRSPICLTQRTRTAGRWQAELALHPLIPLPRF